MKWIIDFPYSSKEIETSEVNENRVFDYIVSNLERYEISIESLRNATIRRKNEDIEDYKTDMEQHEVERIIGYSNKKVKCCATCKYHYETYERIWSCRKFKVKYGLLEVEPYGVCSKYKA